MMRLQQNETRKKRKNSMTKFDELMDIITRNKNKDKNPSKTVFDHLDKDDDIEIEVSGTDSTRAPLITSADDSLDPDIIDMLYTKPRNVPNRGENASSWDSDY